MSKKIIIVGLGCTGTALLLNLLSKNSTDEIVLFESNQTINRGLAYSTINQNHLLNVPAGKMSILYKQPNHFFEWLSKNGYSYDRSSFVPRSIYGDYLVSSYNEAILKTKTNFKIISKNVINITKHTDQYAVVDSDGVSYIGDVVVIASGWHNPERELSNNKYNLHNIPRQLAGEGQALIVGTGLTAVDSILSIRSAGYKGKITMLSRRGLLPKVHNLDDTLDNFTYDKQNLLSLLRIVRSKIDARKSIGLSWHGVIDALRPYHQTIWTNMQLKEKRSFLRHLRPYWDVHRHRMATKIHDFLTEEIKNNKTEIIAGRFKGCKTDHDKVIASIHPKNTLNAIAMEFDFIVNASGMQIMDADKPSVFYQNLIDNNIAALDDLKLGLRLNLDCQLLNKNNQVVNNAYGLGPIGLGSLWETIAVPEISRMAFNLSERLAGVN